MEVILLWLFFWFVWDEIPLDLEGISYWINFFTVLFLDVIVLIIFCCQYVSASSCELYYALLLKSLKSKFSSISWQAWHSVLLGGKDGNDGAWVYRNSSIFICLFAWTHQGFTGATFNIDHSQTWKFEVPNFGVDCK